MGCPAAEDGKNSTDPLGQLGGQGCLTLAHCAAPHRLASRTLGCGLTARAQSSWVQVFFSQEFADPCVFPGLNLGGLSSGSWFGEHERLELETMLGSLLIL